MSNEINKNKSPSSAYGQWQNFSMGLQKLGDYSTNLRSSRRLTPVKQEQEWFSDVASGVADLSSKFYKDYEDRTNLKVETYRNARSLEDIQKDIVEKKVPFQNDALAMTLLKRQVGNMYFQMADQEFSNQITNGHFVGKSPEEVDKAKFEHMQKTLDEIRQSNALDFENPQDQAFLYGFYENSYKSRMLSMSQNDEITNKHYTEKAIEVDKSTTYNKYSTGYHKVEEVEADINAQQTVTGYRYSPSQRVARLTNHLDALANNTTDGTRLLKELRYRKDASGNTFESIIGGAKVYDKFIADSELREITANVTNKYTLQNTIDDLARNPTPENIAKIIAGRDSAIESSGGVETAQTKMWNKGYEDAIKNLEKGTSAINSQIKDVIAGDRVGAWYIGTLAGTETRSFVEASKQWRDEKITEAREKAVMEALAKNTLENGSTEDKARLLILASRGEFKFAFAGKVVKDYFARNFSTMNESVNTYMKTGSLPSSILEDAQGTATLNYGNLGVLQGNILQGIPREVLPTLELYSSNPSAFLELFKDEKIGQQFSLIDQALRNGQNPIQALAGLKEYEALDSRQRAQIDRKVDKIAYSYNQGIFFDDKTTIPVNSPLRAYAYSQAMMYMRANPDADFSVVMDNMRTRMEESYSSLSQNTFIPRAQIRSYTGTYDVSNETLDEQLQDTFKDYTKDILKIPGEELKNYLPYTLYNSVNNAILVNDKNGRLVGEIPLEILCNMLMGDVEKKSSQDVMTYSKMQKAVENSPIGVDLNDR